MLGRFSFKRATDQRGCEPLVQAVGRSQALLLAAGGKELVGECIGEQRRSLRHLQRGRTTPLGLLGNGHDSLPGWGYPTRTSKLRYSRLQKRSTRCTFVPKFPVMAAADDTRRVHHVDNSAPELVELSAVVALSLAGVAPDWLDLASTAMSCRSADAAREGMR